MFKLKILAISPYEGFKRYFSNAIEQHPNIEADVYSASLKQAVVLIKTLDLSQYDVIICRGRTGQMIKNIVDIPVVNVDFSGYDILRSIKLAQCTSYEKIAFVSFFEIKENVNFLCELMDYHTEIIIPPPPQTPADMMELICNLQAEGIQLFIGDGACVDCAKAIGADHILVTSGPESMNKAIEDAIEICKYHRQVIEKNSFFRSLIELSHIPIAVFDQNAKLLHTNIFSIENMKNVYPHMIKTMPKLFTEKTLKAIRNDGKMWWRIRGECIEFNGTRYALFYILDSFLCAQRNQEVFNILEYAEAQNSISLISNSSVLSSSWSKIQTLVDSKIPVLVYGSAGSGKSTFVHAVYASSPFRNNSLIIIECSILDSKSLAMLFENEKSPLFENDYAVYFKNINTLSLSLQHKLNYYLKNSAFTSRNKVLSSFAGDPTASIQEKLFSQDLYYTLAGLPIHTPSLSERTEEIPSIARIYLNQLNQELPVQVVGFEPEALEILKNSPWQYGISQFKLVLKQLVLASTSQLITCENVKLVLSHIETTPSPPKEMINLNRTLDEICKDIIQVVLQEEDMNQSKAAKRLGISRSTLWKKLKGPSTS